MHKHSLYSLSSNVIFETFFLATDYLRERTSTHSKFPFPRTIIILSFEHSNNKILYFNIKYSKNEILENRAIQIIALTCPDRSWSCHSPPTLVHRPCSKRSPCKLDPASPGNRPRSCTPISPRTPPTHNAPFYSSSFPPAIYSRNQNKSISNIRSINYQRKWYGEERNSTRPFFFFFLFFHLDRFSPQLFEMIDPRCFRKIVARWLL